MNQESYRRYQWLASFAIACFIVNFALCLLPYNRSVYKQTAKQLDAADKQEGADSSMEVSGAEATLYFEQLADDFCSYFKSEYEVAGYTLSQANVDALNHIKRYYRWAWLYVCFAVGLGVYAFRKLWIRRETRPLVFGSIGAVVWLLLRGAKILWSKKQIYVALRAMILRRDYSFFVAGDLMSAILPGDYARMMALLYVAIVCGLIVICLGIRCLIRYLGKPHRF